MSSEKTLRKNIENFIDFYGKFQFRLSFAGYNERKNKGEEHFPPKKGGHKNERQT
ncbi:MAG: hypothetical protein IJR61_07305 [Clostridia bacterium]|nr:hypothetical protein [Clostridia bacterium]